MLKELRRVPPGFAAFLVLGAAAVTMILLAALDSTISGGGSTPAEQAAAKHSSPVLDLGKTKYPKGRKQPAAPAPTTNPEQEPAPSPNVPLRRLVGQKLIVRMSGTAPSAELLSRVRKGKVGGVIIFPENVAGAPQLRFLTSSLQRAARAGGAQGFIVAVDQEGGPVKRLRAGPPNRAPAQIASANVALDEGAATGSYLAGLGVNVDLAPVLDVRVPGSFIADRTFASTPGGVAQLGGAFASGLQRGGVGATAKHFPGLGHATANTDTGPSTVGASKAVLDSELAPFSRAIAGGISLVMMSNATYPAYGQRPAVLSRPVVQGILRGRLGFDGVIITDDLEAGAIRAVMPPGDAAVGAAQAGVDMLLLARSPASYDVAYRALLSAAKSGRLDRGALEQSYARIGQLQAEHTR